MPINGKIAVINECRGICFTCRQIIPYLNLCEPNDQLNVCTTSVTEGEVAGVKLVKAPQLFITDRSKGVVLVWSLLAVSVSEFR